MRKLYKIIFLFILVNFSSTLAYSSNKAEENAIIKTVVDPSGQITGNATVCQNAVAPLIKFEVIDDNGKEPYKFTYTINGVTQSSIVTQGNSKSVTIPAPTNVINTFTYILTDVTDKDNNTVAVSSSKTVTINVIPNFTVNAGSDILACRGNQINLISTVTGNGSNTVSYSWSGPNGFTSSQQSPSISNSSIAMSGNYTVTASVGNCQVQDVVNVQVINVGITNPSTLNACLSQSQTSAQVGLILTLPSNSSLIQSITIIWGDNPSPQVIPQSDWSIPITHNYPVGSYTVTITATTSLGCNTTQNYTAFIGSSPQAATLSLFASQASGCSPHTTNFTFGIPISNSDGTNYLICFGDNSASCINFVDGSPIPSDWIFSGTAAGFNLYTITHVYNTTSCGNSVNLNGTTYNNVFLPSVITTNPCTAPQPQAGSLISVGLAPTASFTLNPIPNACVNTPITLNNTSNFGGTIDPITYSCSSTSPFYWTITPSGTALWTANGLGSNNGYPNNELFWTSGSMTPSITFKQPGNYTITLNVKNSCGINSVSHTICIEPPLTPQFTLNNTSGCSPQSITATNTTVTTNSCTTPTYTWSVTHTPAYCGTSIAAIPNQTTKDAAFNFTEPGTYTITLTATNSCSPPQVSSQTVTVKKPPTVTINTIASICQTGSSTSINPTATVPPCANATYAWSFPGGTPATSTSAVPGAISYATAGNHTVSLSVTNECGTTVATDKTFTINPLPTITGDLFSCVGFTSQLTGSATAATTSAWLSSNPAIATVSSTGLVTGVSGGSTTITYTNSNNCITTALFTVNSAPTITPLVSSTVCIGGTPNVLSFTISGATGTPTYQWYSNITNSNTGGNIIPGETNTTFNPPASVTGTFYYYCIITLPSGGCSNIKTNTATVVITPLLTISTQPIATQNLCVGGTIPSPLSVTTTGGTGTLTYQWYSNTTNSTTGATLVGTNAATYPPPVFNAVGTFYYYVVVSANGSGCGTVTSTFSEVVVVADPSISVQPLVTQTQCQNSAATPLTVAAIDGIVTFTYQWYKTLTPTNTGESLVGTNSSSYLPLTDVVGTFYYYCLVSQTGLGCSVKSNIATVIVVTAPQITTHPQSTAVCGGAILAPLTVAFSNGTGTATYQWYDDIGLIAGATSDTYTPTNTVTTNYYCIITFSSGGCTSITSNTATITINPQPTISVQPLATQNLCVGGTISSPLSVTPAGGTGTPSYQWFNNTTNTTTGGTSITGANSSTYTPPALTIAQMYNYYVVITYSGGGCSSITSNLAQIVVVNDPTVTTQPLAMQTVCQGSPATVLSVVASGGLGSNYSYQWYSNSSDNTTSGTLLTGEINDSFTPPTASPGTLYYYCVITQATGTNCNVTSATAKVTVNLAPAFTTTLTPSIICLGQNPSPLTIVTNSDAFSPNYQWYSNATNLNSGGTLLPSATNGTFIPPNSTAGTTYYYCVVTFPSITGSCSEIISSPVQVIINPNPVISNKTAIICSGNSFTISPLNSGSEIVPAGTTYTWSNPTISPAGSITGASTQSTPQTNISQTLTNTTTSPATVTYSVTPLSGNCTGTNFTIVVTVNPAISPNVTSNNSSCFGANNGAIQTNITGGIPFSSGSPYTISWTGPNSFASSASNISNLTPGDYTLSITDQGGCPINKTYTITEPNDIVITTDLEKDITCFNAANGEIKITLSGGTLNYTIAWTKNGLPYAVTEDLSNLSPGTYVVTVSDANNCGPKTATFTITEPPILAVSLGNKTNILCFGQATGTIDVNVVGGTLPYLYAWTGPNGFTSLNQNLTTLFAGTYNLIVTDNSGCAKNLSVTLTQTPEIIIQATTTPIVCYGDNNASINIVVSGGIAPYQISWSNLGSGTFQDNLSAGDYLITVTDALNCTKTLNVNIPEAPIFTVNPVVKNISCFGAKNGSINLNFIGGIAPIKLTWSDSSVAGTTRNNLGPGSYTVTIIDGKPCTIVRTFTILEPQALVLSANTTNDFDCDNANSGAINLMVSGGSAPFTYNWSNGATTEDLTNIPAGNYLVSVTDANGCTKQAQYSINRPPPLVAGVVTNTDFDCETKYVKQTFVAQVSGGIPPYQLTWSSGTASGVNNEMMNTNQNGTVILNVTDALGCKTNHPFLVDTPVLGTPSFDTSSYAYSTFGIYSINDPIQFTNTATGDYIGMSWDFGDGTFSTEINPKHKFVNPKDYVVTQTVTYPFGCVYVQKITFIVGKGYVLVVPNAFTPNNDTLNDKFKPVTKTLKNVHLDIYDTWGSLIYSETGDVLRGWDGKIKGSNTENGNYYCKVSGETFYGTIVNENHPFVLIK